MAEEGAQVRRRRACEKCGQRFTTLEKPHLAMPQVLKRSGDPEPYSEEKLRHGLERAIYKRPVTPEQIDHLVEHIERRLRSQPNREISSRQIGEWVMEELRDIDQVALRALRLDLPPVSGCARVSRRSREAAGVSVGGIAQEPIALDQA